MKALTSKLAVMTIWVAVLYTMIYLGIEYGLSRL